MEVLELRSIQQQVYHSNAKRWVRMLSSLHEQRDHLGPHASKLALRHRLLLPRFQVTHALNRRILPHLSCFNAWQRRKWRKCLFNQ